MKALSISKRIAINLPGIHAYLLKKRLNETIRLQHDEIIGLRQAVNHLELRNKEWACEVDALRGEPEPMRIIWPVTKADLLHAQFKKPSVPVSRKKAPYTINWVIPPMGEASGGHTTILRAIQYLESKKHICRLYIYDPLHQLDLERVKSLLIRYPRVAAEVYYNEKSMKPSDAIFATSWHTAYPVANDTSGAKKFYFVQDFEPTFDPVGSYSTLAENTYKFGLFGVTIGSWLTDKLSREYNMPCDYFEFGVNAKEYSLTNTGQRKKILFYARPVTPRRGFELGVLCLEKFHKNNPDFEIHMFGWDISAFKMPFPYVNHGILNTTELSALYNECAAGLVLSFTNMSLLPLELLAAGCVPVMNDAVNTRAVGYAEELEYADPLPAALALKLEEVARRQQTGRDSKRIAEFAQKFSWRQAHSKMEDIITAQLSQ